MANDILIDQGHVRVKRCRYGPMLYLVTDTYVGQSLDRYGEFSEGEAEVLRQIIRPGQVILEVGANMGAHTVMLAQTTGPGGRVVAFEPQRIMFQILCGNVALNALSNVTTYWTAIGREEGTVLVPSLDCTKARNFGGLALGQWPQGEQVRLITIDSLELPACHMIKVDVEGMEADVIAGAEETIKRFRPKLYVENDRKEKSAALIEMLLGMKYRLYWHLPRLFNQQNFFENTHNAFGLIVSSNMLCIPRSAPQNIQLREITSPASDWKSPEEP